MFLATVLLLLTLPWGLLSILIQNSVSNRYLDFILLIYFIICVRTCAHVFLPRGGRQGDAMFWFNLWLNTKWSWFLVFMCCEIFESINALTLELNEEKDAFWIWRVNHPWVRPPMRTFFVQSLQKILLVFGAEASIDCGNPCGITSSRNYFGFFSADPCMKDVRWLMQSKYFSPFVLYLQVRNHQIWKWSVVRKKNIIIIYLYM